MRALLLLLALIGDALALPPEVAAQVKAATALLRVAGGEGSGFFVEPGLLITNAHVVGPPGTPTQVVIAAGTRASRSAEGRVLAADPTRDLALVRVEGMDAAPLALGDDAEVYETQPVVASGFPLGTARTVGGAFPDPPVSLRPGAVTALHRDRGDKLVMIEHNTNMQQGNSGGPLVDERGRVIGVNVAMLRADESTKFAIPAGVLRAFLAEAPRAAPATVAATIPPPPPALLPAPNPDDRGRRIIAALELGAVADAVASPLGGQVLLGADGSVFRLAADFSWTQLSGGPPMRGLAVDPRGGTPWAVDDNTGLYRHDGERWALERAGRFVGVAADGERVWAVTPDGTIWHRAGGVWVDLQLDGAQGVTVCGDAVFARAGARLWPLADGLRLSRPFDLGVRDLACAGERVYLLTEEGLVLDLRDGRPLDDDPLNARLFATGDGLLMLTGRCTSGEGRCDVWFRPEGTGDWARLRSH